MSTLFNISQFSEDSRFASAVGRIRGLEAQLLPAARLEHLLRAGSWHALLHALRDTAYGALLTGARNSRDIQDAIQQIFTERFRLVYVLAAPDQRLIRTLFTMHDFANLVVLAKSALSESPRRVPLSAMGLGPPENLEKAVQQRGQIPEPLTAAWRIARQDFDRHHSLVRVEMLLWREYLDYVRGECERSGILFAQALHRYQVDTMALMFALRWRHWLEQAASEAAFPPDLALFPADGNLPTDKIQSLIEAEFSRIPQILHYTSYGAIFENASEIPETSGLLWQLELSLENLLTEVCRLTRYTSFGIEPLVAYLWFARQEYKNMRLILLGLFRNMNTEIIASRLREPYG